MNCPACKSSLQKFVFLGVEVDQCGSCCGAWLDHREIDELFGTGELPHRLTEGDVQARPEMTVPEGDRICPRCLTLLTLVEVDDISLDVCAQCKGFFADLGELKALARAAEIRFEAENQ